MFPWGFFSCRSDVTQKLIPPPPQVTRKIDLSNRNAAGQKKKEKKVQGQKKEKKKKRQSKAEADAFGGAAAATWRARLIGQQDASRGAVEVTGEQRASIRGPVPVALHY